MSISIIPGEAEASRFWSKVDKTPGFGPQGDCWRWTGWQNPVTGYGHCKVKVGTRRFTRSAHTVAYELTNGPIPEGLEPDHLCNTRLCCNPSHMEPVTHAENQRRMGARYRHQQGPNCQHGHPWAETARFDNSGKRYCGKCRSAAVRRSQEARMERDPEFAAQMRNRWRKYYKHKRVRAAVP